MLDSPKPAWGIMHGCINSVGNCLGNNNNFVYTAINYVESGLDGVVKTSP